MVQTGIDWICSSHDAYNTENRLEVSFVVKVAGSRYTSQNKPIQIVKSQSPSRTNLLDSQSVKTDISLHFTGVERFANKSVLSGIVSSERALVSQVGSSHSVKYRSSLFVCVHLVSSRFSTQLKFICKEHNGTKLSQCRTAVLHCCKGDAASQWEMAISGVSELQ